MFIDTHRTNGEFFKPKSLVSFEQSQSMMRQKMNQSFESQSSSHSQQNNEEFEIIAETTIDDHETMEQNKEYIYKALDDVFSGIETDKL